MSEPIWTLCILMAMAGAGDNGELSSSKGLKDMITARFGQRKRGIFNCVKYIRVARNSLVQIACV